MKYLLLFIGLFCCYYVQSQVYSTMCDAVHVPIKTDPGNPAYLSNQLPLKPDPSNLYISTLSKGIYLVKVSTFGESKTKQLIIQ